MLSLINFQIFIGIIADYEVVGNNTEISHTLLKK